MALVWVSCSLILQVGGSLGHVSMSIADSAPDLSFIVQDLPSTAAKGDAVLPSQYRSRISFQAYDLNEVQPVNGMHLLLFPIYDHSLPQNGVATSCKTFEQSFLNHC